MTNQTEPLFKKPITVALTGASGAQYGLRLIDVLVAASGFRRRCTIGNGGVPVLNGNAFSGSHGG